MNGKVFVHRPNWLGQPGTIANSEYSGSFVWACIRPWGCEQHLQKQWLYWVLLEIYVSQFNKCRFFKKWYVWACIRPWGCEQHLQKQWLYWVLLEIYVSHFHKCRFFKKWYVHFLLSSSCNTVVTNLPQNIYCRYKAVTSISWLQWIEDSLKTASYRNMWESSGMRWIYV